MNSLKCIHAELNSGATHKPKSCIFRNSPHIGAAERGTGKDANEEVQTTRGHDVTHGLHFSFNISPPCIGTVGENETEIDVHPP